MTNKSKEHIDHMQVYAGQSLHRVTPKLLLSRETWVQRGREVDDLYMPGFVIPQNRSRTRREIIDGAENSAI